MHGGIPGYERFSTFWNASQRFGFHRNSYGSTDEARTIQKWSETRPAADEPFRQNPPSATVPFQGASDGLAVFGCYRILSDEGQNAT
jgi:hypothetical protein